MCRLLCVKAERPFGVSEYLRAFADVARLSTEYQGHGWGFAWRDDSQWRLYHNISPIWEDNLDREESTTVLLVHARSAFENRNIAVENNMPFANCTWAFIFNGELRGVRIRVDGRIGAEKIFNLLMSRDRGAMQPTLVGIIRLLEQRTAILKASNMILSDGHAVYVASRFNINPEYYTMWREYDGDRIVICSEPFVGESDWKSISQGVEMVA